MPSVTFPLRRGDIVRVRLDPVEGHEQAGVRPALVLSPEIINENLNVIIVAAITSKRLDLDLPFEAKIKAGEGGLKSDSRVMLMQIRTLDKRRVLSRYGTLTAETMRSIDKALAISTGLMRI